MKIWKSLKDLEKKDVILQSDKILLELKKTVLESGLFRDNTHPAIPQFANSEFRYHFIGQNLEMYWFDEITDLVFLLTRVKKITKKSFWGEQIEEEKEEIRMVPFETCPKSKWDWDFDDLHEQSNFDNLKLNESEKTFLNKIYELLNLQILKANEKSKQDI